MFVPAGSPIFFLREHRFAVRCRVVTLRQLLWTLFTPLFMLSMCLLHIFLYIFFINIGCATLHHLSMMYVTVSGAIYGFARSADRAAQFADPHIGQLICRSRNHRQFAQAYIDGVCS